MWCGRCLRDVTDENHVCYAADPRPEAREIADANAAILRLQKRLDAVRPVVRAAAAYTGAWGAARAHLRDRPSNGAADFESWQDEHAFLDECVAMDLALLGGALDALPAADREWAQKGE